MGARIRVLAGGVSLEVELNDSRTARAVEAALPLAAEGNRWGEEIYFEVPLDLPPEAPTTDVDVGDVAYWPPGKAIAIFFGPTPMSEGEKPVPASEVNPVGKVSGDPRALREFRSGQSIKLERA